MRTKKAPILTALAVLLIFVSSYSAVSQSVPPQAKDKKEKESDKQERGIRIRRVKELPAKAKRFALVIGIDQYNDTQINRLDGAANDAKAIAEALVEYSGFPQDQVILLTNGQPQNLQPTKNSILRKLSNLTRDGVPKDGLLLVFFAGHGIEKEGHAFLLPTDAEVSNDVNLLQETAIPVERVNAMIRQSGIQQIILILDACRNNPEVGRGDESQKLSKTYTKNFDFETKNSEISAFATLYASELGQTAYEYKEKKHGYFTWALIEGIKGGAANEQGEVTLSNLRKYLQETVPKRVSLDLGAGKRQRPFAEIKGFKAEDLVFAWVKPREVKTAEVKPTGSVLTIDPAAKDLVFWDSIKDLNDPDLYQAYLDKFPNGEFVAIAKNRLANLQGQQAISSQPQITTIPPPPPSPVDKKAEEKSKSSPPEIAKGKKDKKPKRNPPPLEMPKTRTAAEEIAKLPDAQQVKDSVPKEAAPPSEVPKQIATELSNIKDTVKDEVPSIPPKPDIEKLKQQTDKEEKLLWNNIDESTNPEDFKHYLASFPKGKYAAKAATKIAELTELSDWNAVKESQKKEDIRNFLTKYPKSTYAKEANLRLTQIDEDVYWNSIKDSQGIDNFKTYMMIYPKGAYVEQAKARVKDLTPATKSRNETAPVLEKIEAQVSIPPAIDKQSDSTIATKNPESPSPAKNEVTTYIENSEKFIREKKWKDAIEMLNHAIKLEPETVEWHYRLGTTYVELKKWQEAESAFRKAVELEATKARWQNSLGLFLSARDQHPEAIERCKKATELEPDNAKFRADLSQALLNQYGIAQEDLYSLKNNQGLRNRLNRIDTSNILQAEAEARKAIHIENENPHWHIQLSKVLMWLDKRAEAEHEARQAIHLNPLNPEWYNQLGLILLAQERFQDAQTAFREATRLAPSNHAYKENFKKAGQK
jgi:Flp pilus assembly protein TadD